MFSQNTIEIQSELKFSVKAKAKYNRNRNSEGYPTLELTSVQLLRQSNITRLFLNNFLTITDKILK